MGISLDNITNDSVEHLLFNGNIEDSPIVDIDDGEEKENEEIIENDFKLKPIEKSSEEDDSGEVDGQKIQEKNLSKEDINGHSPNLYTSIAKDFLEAGVLNLDDSEIENVKSAEDFLDLFQKQLDSLKDEEQKRISDALNGNVPVDEIRQYETVIKNLNSISTEQIEDEANVNLRKDIIYNELISKGFSEARATREVEKSLNTGNDIEDAKEALASLQEHYKQEYAGVIEKAKQKESKRVEEEKKQLDAIKTKFMNTEEPVKGIKLNKIDREKLYKQATQYVSKDDSGKPMTAIQQFAKNNPVDYQYYINLLFYQTNGFKDLSNVVTKEVNSQVRKAMNNVEKTIKSGNSFFESGVTGFGNNTDMQSYSGLRLKLD